MALDEASVSKEESLLAMHSATLVSEGACSKEQYCVLFPIVTSED